MRHTQQPSAAKPKPKRGALKGLSILFTVYSAGAAMGALAEYKWITVPTLDLVERGFCGGMDAAKQLYWYACRDAFVAMELEQRQIERDAETLTILKSMEGNQPKVKTVKVKQ